MAWGEHREKHGMTGTRIHNIWRGIKMRCYNPNVKSYEHYGGRGIKMSEEWRTSFLSFYKWAIENGYNDELTIDRINVNGDYCSENCRWQTWKQQENNRSNNDMITFDGKTMTQAQWAEYIGIDKRLLNARLVRCGWTVEKALTTPVRKHRPYRYV
ncbi:MAG: hypothetical protein WBP82_03780 [Leuconostoc mesenteroides]